MHGEYKVPGGKLVVVDLEVVDGRIDGFRLAGDFFLEPDDALPRIDAAVNGLPVETDAAGIAAAVRAALPEGAVLLGFTPEAVATAVRRSLARASTWQDHDWEIIHEGPIPPNEHLALDQVLTEEVGAGRRGPTLRIWEWDQPAVVIGSFQSLRNEVDPAGAARYGVEVVRRISGGGAMFMDAGAIISYSLYVPADLVQGMSFADSYAYLDEWVIEALKSLGIEAWYQPLNDITSAKGKIGGAAQKRLGTGAILHHATMSYDMDGEKMVQVLRIGREKMSDKGTTSAAKRVDPLRSQTGLSRAEIIDRLIATFTRLYGAHEGHVTPEERARAQELVATKFATREWLERVP
ncbi:MULTISPECIES: biotin/lipoate A/B protein ligase family protein [unclassified Curtobacterium]|uniref:lipoate--protein ligase family protein n=1 Tax=unclassified Curtobacterium TaxID=257496 RepID=UPI000DA88CC6|nr:MULTISPECIES: biotin/lipoate A/B protein ligase family protein [unclassified Curtobacterium]PZE25719.1 lipoate--protein ligase family protein [Curtobacterium sp. MCBD17_028]PZE78404.1 lipoate--protein ligase family protein [Curtobacterium sp. MCBD17_019]PZF62566.1 lipoate--protein ligase family protein [Curtobacterium sp. MCBD17_034]PZF63359.1 lipoate--protein ligase family protein [Curtobacterium sp. MCBD17_013]PZM39727.1 lipoate--protein ligase family protein [Curtobacterium sp. MCBD17_03